MLQTRLAGGAPVYFLGAAGLLVSAVSWSVASVLSKRLPLPSSKVMSAATQMLVGGLLLCIVAAASGEERGFHPGGVFVLASVIVITTRRRANFAAGSAGRPVAVAATPQNARSQPDTRP